VAALDLLQPWLATYDQSMAAQQDYADEIMSAHGVPRDVCLAVRAMGRRGRGWGAPVTVTTPLAADEELRLRDRTLTVRHRPGHSPSDTIFCDLDQEMMIGGDHLLGRISSNPVVTRPLSGPAYPRSQPLVTYLSSLQLTAAEPHAVILPGHGQAIHDHQRLIGARLTMHRQRRDRLHGLIIERPHTAHELAVELWGDDAIKQATLTISEVLGHIDLLLNDGYVTESQDSAGVTRFVAGEDRPIDSPGWVDAAGPLAGDSEEG
jgi:glyoxylase-like metal-dependent hydrolase (beta-lactamase superfamily II)